MTSHNSSHPRTSHDSWSLAPRLFRHFTRLLPKRWISGQHDVNESHPNVVANLAASRLSSRPADQRESRHRQLSDSITSEQSFSVDSHFWWTSVAPMLQKLMSFANYSERRSNAALDDFLYFVVDYLGPRPRLDGTPATWRSFMTDDFTPLELSCSWGSANKTVGPKIRFSIEPINGESGKASDPWNSKATINLMRMLKQNVGNMDTNIFDDLTHRLNQLTCDPPQASASTEIASSSSMFLAFELEDQEPMIKAYMLPFRSIVNSQKSCADLTIDFLTPFAREQRWESLTRLLGFLATDGNKSGIEPFMIAFDCVPLAQTRMKIYVRSAGTSFNDVKSIMSMFQDPATISTALDDLQALWGHLFERSTTSDLGLPLHQKDHETSGILYYLEVRPGSDNVTMKVYLPVKHYASNDLSAAKGLVAFLQSKRGLNDQFINSYLSTLADLCTHRKLEDGSGLQTYISCAIKNGDLDVTSYINPEVYYDVRFRTENATP